jgi:hypothetical protein
MAGVDFDRDFPQPPVASRSTSGRVRVGYAEPQMHRIEIALTHALEVDEGDGQSRRIDAIMVRRITAAQMIAIVEGEDAPQDDRALTRYVIAAMCGEPVEVLDGLFPDDAWRVAQAATPFLPAGLVAALGVRMGAMEADVTV